MRPLRERFWVDQAVPSPRLDCPETPGRFRSVVAQSVVTYVENGRTLHEYFEGFNPDSARKEFNRTYFGTGDVIKSETLVDYLRGVHQDDMVTAIAELNIPSM